MHFRKIHIIPLVILSMIVVGVASLTILIQTPQDIRQRAAGTTRADIDFPITKKVMILEFDPIIESQGGQRISQILNANDPHILTDQYIADIKSTSGGFANYEILSWQEIDDVPVLKDGFDYTDEQYLACAQNAVNCHNPSGTDYNKIITTYDLCNKRNSGEIDEVWMWDVGGMGFYEAVMTGGPQAFHTNGPPVTNTTCQKALHIMGFNAIRAVGEMLESFGHRVEGTLSYVFGEDPRWAPYPHNTDWGKFAIWDKAVPGQAGCGWTHYPHNGVQDYDWSNQTLASTNCEDWLNYPNLTGFRETINCSRWNCDGYRFKYMWLSHLPKYKGVRKSKLINWWHYILDYEEAQRSLNVIDSGSSDVNSSCRFLPSNNEIYFGTDESCTQTSDFTAGFHFIGIKLEKAQIISGTYLSFTVDGPYSNSLELEIIAEAIDNAVPFSETHQPSDVNYTQNRATWIVDQNWTLGNTVNTPNLAPVINEIISRPGWQSGNSINIIVRNKSGSGHRRIFAYERDSERAAGLSFIFAHPFPTPSPSPTVLPSSSILPSTSPSPNYTILELKSLIKNYQVANDSEYKPIDGKINMLDTGWVMKWLKTN